MAFWAMTKSAQAPETTWLPSPRFAARSLAGVKRLRQAQALTVTR
jgi:hypothetical protein